MTSDNGPRRIYLLRHAQSEFQVIYEQTGIDPGIVDAPLSTKGFDQVRKLRSGRNLPKLDLIISSPLSRCLDTALALQSTQDATPIEVNPLVRERLGDMCDIGKPASVLAKRYVELDFSHLPETWWHQGPEDARGVPIEPRDLLSKRVEELRERLRSFGTTAVAVVSHSGFLSGLTGAKLENCELYDWDMIGKPERFAVR